MELKPCPWCGAKMNITYSSAAGCFNVWHSWVGTWQCGMAEPFRIHDDDADSLAEAAKIWNKRKQDSVLGKIVRELQEQEDDRK